MAASTSTAAPNWNRRGGHRTPRRHACTCRSQADVDLLDRCASSPGRTNGGRDRTFAVAASHSRRSNHAACACKYRQGTRRQKASGSPAPAPAKPHLSYSYERQGNGPVQRRCSGHHSRHGEPAALPAPWTCYPHQRTYNRRMVERRRKYTYSRRFFPLRYPPAQPVQGETAASGAVDATYTQRDGSVDLRRFELQTPASQLDVHGHLGAYPLTSATALAVDFHSHNLWEFDTVLRDLGLNRYGKTGAAALPVNLAGQGDFHGTWTGSMVNPHIAGILKATQLAIELLPVEPVTKGKSVPPEAVQPGLCPGIRSKQPEATRLTESTSQMACSAAEMLRSLWPARWMPRPAGNTLLHSMSIPHCICMCAQPRSDSTIWSRSQDRARSPARSTRKFRPMGRFTRWAAPDGSSWTEALSTASRWHEFAPREQ